MKKRKKYFSVGKHPWTGKIFLIITTGIYLYSCFSCAKESPENENSVITNVGIEEMGHLYISEFELRRSWPKFNEGREYNFIKENTSESLYIRVGLFKSREDAEEIANEICREISVYLNEGPHQGTYVGDNFWWFDTADTNSLTNLIFTRKNALFIMGAHGGYKELKTLAKKIDDDILRDAEYVDLGNKIMIPVIDSIKATKPVMNYGETTLITVYASDPANQELQYNSIGLSNSKYQNVFVEVATPSYVPEPFFGSHIYEFTVINESNAISEVAEFELIITE